MKFSQDSGGSSRHSKIVSLSTFSSSSVLIKTTVSIGPRLAMLSSNFAFSKSLIIDIISHCSVNVLSMFILIYQVLM